MAQRLQQAVRALDPDQRLAGLAAIALLVTMFLPWYDRSVVVPGADRFVTETYSAFGQVTFIEAAVFLIALSIFVLLFARGERRGFHLPGGDGTVVMAAGVWVALLLLWRVFDKPELDGRVGITWGFFFAFLAAAALAGAGWRIRQAARPEPPNPVARA